MNLKQKVIGCFLCIALLVNLAEYYNILTSHSTNQRYIQMVENTLPTISALERIRQDLSRWRSHTIASLWLQTERDLAGSNPWPFPFRSFKQPKVDGQLLKSTNQFKINSSHPQKEKLGKRMDQQEIIITKLVWELHQLKRQGVVGQRILNKYLLLDNALKQYLMLVDAAHLHETQRLEFHHRQAQRQVQVARIMKIMIMVALILISILLGLLLTTSIVNPLTQLKEAALKIGQGQLDTTIELANRDEIGVLANTINKMAQDLSQTTISRNYVDKIFQTMPSYLLVATRELKIESVTPATAHMLGYTKEDLQGQDLTTVIVSPGEITREDELFDQGYFYDRESSFLTADQKKIPVLMSASLMHSTPQNIEGVVIVALDLTERKQLEQEIISISEREQKRIGQDLHDGLGQVLTGIAFMGKLLQQKLEAASRPEAETAREIVSHINQSILQTRQLSAGLFPVELERGGLTSALKELALQMESLCEIDCQFHHQNVPPIYDLTIATHLYRIAQEAANNAIKHGQAQTLIIRLERDDTHLELSVTDDGPGLPSSIEEGIGMRTMRYRAQIIGGQLQIKSGSNGTSIICRLALNSLPDEKQIEK